MSSSRSGTRRLRGPLILLAVCAVLGCILLVALAYSASAGTSESAPTRAGLIYANNVMVWIHQPVIVHTRNAELGALPSILPSLTNTALRQNVNTADLIRRFGAHRRVQVLVLSGMYNSLPPDEGVNIQGEVIVLTDLKTDKVLFLTD